MNRKYVLVVFLLLIILSCLRCKSNETPVEPIPSDVILKVEMHLYVFGMGDADETDSATVEDKKLNIHMATEEWRVHQATWIAIV